MEQDNTMMMAFMCAMGQSEDNLIDDAMEALKEYKLIKDSSKDAVKNVFTPLAILLLKVETRDMSHREILELAINRTESIQMSLDYKKMMKSN